MSTLRQDVLLQQLPRPQGSFTSVVWVSVLSHMLVQGSTGCEQAHRGQSPQVQEEEDAMIYKNAKISLDGRYRYWLSRRWDYEGKLLAWIMLNPSTADAEVDDPTIRRVMYFSRREGYSGCLVMNLFALRTPDSSQLRRHPEPVGPLNNRYLRKLALGWDPIVCAWGSRAPLDQVVKVLKTTLRHSNTICLGTTSKHAPRHPLYLPNTQEFEPFA